MFGLTTLVNALNHLASALSGLAATAEQVNAATRKRLQLDATEPMTVNRLPELEEAGYGRKRKS